jgi:hypothetical protein
MMKKILTEEAWKIIVIMRNIIAIIGIIYIIMSGMSRTEKIEQINRFIENTKEMEINEKGSVNDCKDDQFYRSLYMHEEKVELI